VIPLLDASLQMLFEQRKDIHGLHWRRLVLLLLLGSGFAQQCDQQDIRLGFTCSVNKTGSLVLLMLRLSKKFYSSSGTRGNVFLSDRSLMSAWYLKMTQMMAMMSL
jgi:hypothetical protein